MIGKRSKPACEPRRKTATVALPKPEPQPPEHSLLSAYEQQITEMEQSLTGLRQRASLLLGSNAELLEERARLADLFQNAPVGYVIHDHAGAISQINHTAQVLLGLEQRRNSIVSLTQLVSKEQLGLWLDHLRRSTTSLRTITTDLTLRLRKGRLLPVQLVTTAQPAPLHRPAHTFRTVLIDISLRRAAESALSQTQQDYHRLIDAIEGIVWEADAKTFQMTFVSRYAERLLGYTQAEWSRPSFWQDRIYVEDRERVLNAVAAAVAKRQMLRVDYRVLAVDRRILWLHDNITLLERDGQLRLLGVAVDVTERHRMEEDLRGNQEVLEQRVAERTAELRTSMQELEAFSYSISHDLRAPMRAMLGFAEIAIQLGGDQLSPQIKDFLQRIMESGLRADRLVQDVLAYSRVARVNFELIPVNLDKLVHALIDQYPDFQPPKAKIRVHSPLLPVLAHEAILSQCITNLLGNAVKFVAPDAVPRIEVRTEPVPAGMQQPTGDTQHESSPAVRLWIEDNGVGIEPGNFTRIFNIFERVYSTQRYPGTGIGLAIVRKGVERLGGTVGVQSKPGQGSKFWLQLKAAP